MSFLFGGAPPTTSELVRKYKSAIDRSVRELDRESAKLKSQESTLMSEIKKNGITNFTVSKQKAKSVIRTRKIIARFSSMKSHLQDVSSRIQGVKSMESLQTALASATGVMKGFSMKAGNGALLSTLREFEKFNGVMAIQSEMTDDGLNDAFDGEGDEDEIDALIMSSVLQEAGIKKSEFPPSFAAGLQSLPDEDDLEGRLMQLRPQTNTPFTG